MKYTDRPRLRLRGVFTHHCVHPDCLFRSTDINRGFIGYLQVIKPFSSFSLSFFLSFFFSGKKFLIARTAQKYFAIHLAIHLFAKYHFIEEN